MAATTKKKQSKKAGAAAAKAGATTAKAALGSPVGGGGILVAAPFTGTRKYAQTEIRTSLGGRQSWALRCLLEGLEESKAELADGRVVKSSQDAVRWLLEKLADGAALADPENLGPDAWRAR